MSGIRKIESPLVYRSSGPALILGFLIHDNFKQTTEIGIPESSSHGTLLKVRTYANAIIHRHYSSPCWQREPRRKRIRG